MIDDNVAYVSAVLDEVAHQHGEARRVVFAGFRRASRPRSEPRAVDRIRRVV
jgi:hypothetical protein